MFSIFQIGVLEMLSCLLLGVMAMLCFVVRRAAAWRWLAVLFACCMVATVWTPADVLSTWLVSALMGGVFAAGVYLAPYVTAQPRSDLPS